MLSGPTLAEIQNRRKRPSKMKLPLNRKDWPLRAQEDFAERAGIIEFEARLPRDVAEKLAEQDVRNIWEKRAASVR